eukprot:jgi/Ulvmu1/5576/UM023_0113.1
MRAQYRREGVSELMLRLLAANPELQSGQIPLAASLAFVTADDVDGAGVPRWAGYQHGAISCEDLEEAGLPCEEVTGGFDWGSPGGILVAVVLVLLPLAAAALLFWWLRRRSVGPSGSGHELKSQAADTSMDEMIVDRKFHEDEDGILDDAALAALGKVKVDPYEPDGYDPNNVSKILGELTIGEQVIKAKELKQKLLGHDPREHHHDLASGPSDMHGELGPVASGMSAGPSMMSVRDRSHMHSSFMGGGASGMSPSHSLMGGTSAMSGTRSAMWQAERTSSGHAAHHGKRSMTPHKHSSSSRHGQHGHSAHHGRSGQQGVSGQHGHSGQRPHGSQRGHSGQPGHSGQRGASSQMTTRHRSSGQRRQTGGSAPIGQRPDGRPTSGSRSGAGRRTHTLGMPMQPLPHRQHRSSRHPQHRSCSRRKGGAEGKALLELDQALSALQSAVKPAKKPSSSQRKPRPGDGRSSSRSGVPQRHSSRRSQVQSPSVAEAHAKVLKAIDSRLRAASALLANASKTKEKEADAEEDASAPAVEILENDSGVLPISAADGCAEGPLAPADDKSSSAGELSFTLPAAQSAPEDPRQTLQLAGFQWLYTSDNKQSAEALQESIAVVQRQLKENPEIVAQAAAAALNPGCGGEAGGRADGAAGAASAAAGEEGDAEDAQKKNAYAVVAALVATVRAEAAAEAERHASDGYASSDDGEDELRGEESHLHMDAGSDAGSEAGSEEGSDAVSDVGSVMEFASAGEDSFQRQDSEPYVDHVTLSMHAPEDLMPVCVGVVEEEEVESDERASSVESPGVLKP